MKVFNYIRVSTKEQNEQRQIVAMNEYNKSNNIDNAIQLIDKCSGTTKDRPNLEMLLKVVGEGDLVVIKSIDRLSRNYKEVTELWQTITNKGADIVVLDMPILDTTKNKDLLGNLITDLFISILGYVAQTENDFRKQRQSEGIAIAKAEGKHLGRPQAEFPSNWIEEHMAWKEKKQTAKTTMENLGLKRTTFYKLCEIQEVIDLSQSNINKLPKGTVFDLPEVISDWKNSYTKKGTMGKRFKEAVTMGRVQNIKIKGFNEKTRHMEYERI